MSIHACHVMSKPTGSSCNLNCTYCYYLEKEKLYERKAEYMNDSTLEVYIEQYIQAQDTPIVEFVWQGGEPMLAGIDFFKKALHFQQKYAQGKKIYNCLQTNGVLLNDEWCEFFKQHEFLVGISIDGPEDLHDAYRVNRASRGSFKQVVAGIEYLKKHQIEFNTLTVVNDQNVLHPERVYQFLKNIGSNFIQFIPLVEQEAVSPNAQDLHFIDPASPLKAKITPWSVPSKAYGQFLNRIFDVWVKQDIGQVFVQMFDLTLASWCGDKASLCIFNETCGHAFALEANGDLYQCDHYVYPEYKLGNIHHESIRHMNHSNEVAQFALAKKKDLSKLCLKCDYKFLCHGGCPKHRILKLNQMQKHNYFCEGYKLFFKHTEDAMKKMAQLIKRHRSPQEIMFETQASSNAYQQVKRNDLCPCNSGKKYKKCCGS